MLAPRLRHRVTLQSQVQTQNATHGGVTLLWVDVETDLPAEVVPLSGREFIHAQTNQVQSTARITLRYREDIDESMRIIFDGWIFGITAILPDPSARRWLTVMVQRLEPFGEVGEEELDGGNASEDPGGELDGGGA
jgi:SPP1 family predicted phage head-tail adaptor